MTEEDFNEFFLSRLEYLRVVAIEPVDGRDGYDIAVVIDGTYADTEVDGIKPSCFEGIPSRSETLSYYSDRLREAIKVTLKEPVA